MASSPRVKALKSKSSAEEGGNVQVAMFISKVWKIVEEPETDHLISWSESGTTFLVRNAESTFAKEVLPRFFKHSNFASFNRQLNLYGFRKVANPDQGGLVDSVKNETLEFWHTNFRKGHPELLVLVQRRPVSKSDDKAEVSQLMSDIHQMKMKQEAIGSLIEGLQEENYYLKQEVQALKVKHDLQYKVLNKIIHFVVQMVYKGKMPLLKNRLMLTDSSLSDDVTFLPPPAKRSKPSNLDSFTQLDSPMLYSVTSPGDPLSGVIPSPPLQSINEQPSVESGHQDSVTDSYDTSSLIVNDEFLANLLNPLPAESQTTPIVTTPTSTLSSQNGSFKQAVNPSLNNELQSQPDLLQTRSQATVQTRSQTTNQILPQVTVQTRSQTINQTQPPAPQSRLQNQTLSVPQNQFQSRTIIPSDLVQTSSQSSSTATAVQPQSQTSSVDLVPYSNSRMNNVASHLSNHQLELDSLPEVLDINPEILSGLLSMEFSQQIPEYDIVDTARLLESFMDPERADVCHESTVHVPATLALPSGTDSSGSVSVQDRVVSTSEPLRSTPSSTINTTTLPPK